MAGTGVDDRSREITEAWWLLRGANGWMRILGSVFRLTEDEEKMVIELEEAYFPIDRALAQWMKSTERERRLGIFGLETDEEIVSVLSLKIYELYVGIERALKLDIPYQELRLMIELGRLVELEKTRRAARGRILHKLRPPDENRITDHDIARAREYPLERLIPDFEIARYGYVQCRWHEDKKPSMLVKNGFGYCFSCNVAVDAIKWLMDVDKMGFVDAVKYLRGRS